jgi:hypothetical protein
MAGEESMTVQRSRIALLTGLAAVFVRGPRGATAWAETLPVATIYKGAT